MLPRLLPSHCSLSSIKPLPHVWAIIHPPVSSWQLLVHVRDPALKKELYSLQLLLIMPKLVLSQLSPVFTTPFPHLGIGLHLLVSNWQLLHARSPLLESL